MQMDYLKLNERMLHLLNPGNMRNKYSTNITPVETTKILLKLSDEDLKNILTASAFHASIAGVSEESQEDFSYAFLMGFFLARYEYIEAEIGGFLNSTFGPEPIQ